MKGTALSVGLTVVAALSSPAGAFAGTTTVSAAAGVLTVTGDANNNVVVLGTTAGQITVSDTAGTATTAAPCTAAAGVVSCPDAGLTAIAVNLNAGDDQLDATAMTLPVTAHGGDNNDLLQGGSGADSMFGEAGGDDVRGGPGLAPDVLDGGTGINAVDYSARTENLTVDETTPGADDGAAGEGDTVTNCRYIKGGSGNDYLRLGAPDPGEIPLGDRGLYGSDGNDTLIGTGNDMIFGDLEQNGSPGPGADTTVSVQVFNGGTLRATGPLGSYSSVVGTDVPGPSSVTVTKAPKGMTTVRWPAVCGAERYSVVVGTGKAKTTTATHIAVRRPQRTSTVTVTSLARGGAPGGGTLVPLPH